MAATYSFWVPPSLQKTRKTQCYSDTHPKGMQRSPQGNLRLR